MEADRILVDDVLWYGATAFELGEGGEVVNVDVPALTESMRRLLGQRCSVRLEYPGSDLIVRGWYTFQSIAESLSGDGYAIVKFVLEE